MNKKKLEKIDKVLNNIIGHIKAYNKQVKAQADAKERQIKDYIDKTYNEGNKHGNNFWH